MDLIKKYNKPMEVPDLNERSDPIKMVFPDLLSFVSWPSSLVYRSQVFGRDFLTNRSMAFK